MKKRKTSQFISIFNLFSLVKERQTIQQQNKETEKNFLDSFLQNNFPSVKLFTCKKCEKYFGTSEEQRNHFKSLEHREKKEEPKEEEEEDEEEDNLEEGEMLRFQLKNGKYVLLYKSIFPSGSNYLDFLKSMQNPDKPNWLVVMLSGGYFSAGIFANNDKPFLHKSIRKYITRAGQGRVQSSQDNSGNKAISAGSSLRRHNEDMLFKEIHSLLLEWKLHIDKCSIIWIRIPEARKSKFFSDNDIIKKKDIRLRKIPLNTKRPTLDEVCRVYSTLSRAEYEDPE